MNHTVLITVYPDHFIASMEYRDQVFESDGDTLSETLHGLAEELHYYEH